MNPATMEALEGQLGVLGLAVENAKARLVELGEQTDYQQQLLEQLEQNLAEIKDDLG